MRGICKGKRIFRGLAIRDPSGNRHGVSPQRIPSILSFSFLFTPCSLPRKRNPARLRGLRGGKAGRLAGCFRLVRFMGDRPFPSVPFVLV